MKRTIITILVLIAIAAALLVISPLIGILGGCYISHMGPCS